MIIMRALLVLVHALCITSGVVALDVQVNVYAANCSSGMGYAIATASGGIPPYTYNWSDGSTGPEASLPPGQGYTITVTDNAGATGSQTFDIQSALGCCSFQDIYFAGLEPCQGECNGGFRIYLPRVVGGYTFSTTPPMQVQEYVPPGAQPVEYFTLFEIIGACPGQSVSLTVSNDCASASTTVTIPAALVDPTVDVLQINGSCTSSSNGYIAGAVNWTGYGLTAGWTLRPVDDQGATVPNQSVNLSFTSPASFEFFGLHPGNWVLRFTSQESLGSIQSPCVVDIPFVVPDLGSDCGALSGRAFVDANENCFQGFGEPNLRQTVVVAQPGDHYALTNASGQYTMSLPYGTYTVNTSTAVYQEHCGVSATPFTLSAGQPNVVRNLADTSLVGLDVMVSLGSGPARPGFPMTMGMEVRNLTGVLPGTTTVTLTYDPVLAYVSANPAPTSVSGNTLTWTSANLGALQDWDYTVNFTVPPDVGLLGTFLASTATVSVSNPEANLTNNSYTDLVLVTGSYDPNDKTALTSSRQSTDQYVLGTDEWIDYTIRFQNTGTDTAFFVVITDTLPSTLDPATFLPMAASHAHTVSLSGQGILRWNFPTILLPDSNTNEPRSHGFVTFRIRPKQPVLPGTLIENIANIYFDFNPPIITEPSVLMAEFSTGVGEVSTDRLQLYPNPATDVLRVRSSAGAIRSIDVCDLAGRSVPVRVASAHGAEVLLDVHMLAQGPYVLRALDVSGTMHHARFTIH
jgi:uncharacterized repeat protein (TIGR01451 family)